MSTPRLVAAAAALALAGGLTASATVPSAAAPAPAPTPTVTTVAKPFVGVLSVAQAPDGTRWWTDDFASLLYRQAPGGQPTVAFKGTRKGGVEAVSADGGRLRFATGASDNSAGKVWTLDSAGAPVLVADIYAYEEQANPDKRFRYGFLGTPKSCLAQLPPQVPGSYRGVVESHPYATASANGVTYVADAGANAVFAVSATGVVSTVAAIKPARVRVTAAAAAANDLPSCVVGRRIALESVPTDVEVGPDGALYVSNLSGGPEDGSLGANGRISRIDPVTGTVTTLVDGLASATGVAVAPDGRLYVADLFRGAIGTVRPGGHRLRTFAEVPFPAAVEVTPTGLLASIRALPGKKPRSQVVTITP